MGLDSHLIDYS